MLYQRWGSFVRGQFRLLWEVRPPDGVPVGQRRRHVGSQLAYAEVSWNATRHCCPTLNFLGLIIEV